MVQHFFIAVTVAFLLVCFLFCGAFTLFCLAYRREQRRRAEIWVKAYKEHLSLMRVKFQEEQEDVHGPEQ